MSIAFSVAMRNAEYMRRTFVRNESDKDVREHPENRRSCRIAPAFVLTSREFLSPRFAKDFHAVEARFLLLERAVTDLQRASFTHDDSVLWTLEEIGRLVSHSGDPAETLTNIAQLIKQRFGTDVCSVYLLEADRSTLVLAATVGLRQESVGRIRMRLNEGLAGLVGEQLRPQVIEDATKHPRFKYFSEAGEDPVSLVSRRAADRSRPPAGRARRADRRAAHIQSRCRAAADRGRRATRVDRQ